MMDFIPGAVTLDDVTGGTLSVGTVPWERMQKAEIMGKNAGIVTVLPAATEIVELDLGSLAVGDIVLVGGQAQMTKGGVAGECTFAVAKKSGAAGIYMWYQGGSIAVRFHNVGAGEIAIGEVFGVVRCATAGTCVLYFYGSSGGSNSSIPANNGQAWAWVLPTG